MSQCDDFETNIKKRSRRRRGDRSLNRTKRSDDFVSMGSDLFTNINYKIAFFLFVIGILIFSDVFIETALMPISGAVYGDTPTTKGTILQVGVYTIGYVIIDLLVSGGMI